MIDNPPAQHIALVDGQPVFELPTGLYIPPESLTVFLTQFEGPFDLLLYLIKKQNIDILDIPVAKITQQYMGYIEAMTVLQRELAAEYLVMAAMLVEIKSQMLLPTPRVEAAEEESDPRAELVRRLQIYEQFKQAADTLGKLPCVDREYYLAKVALPPINQAALPPAPPVSALTTALSRLLKKAWAESDHAVAREVLSISDRIVAITQRITAERYQDFSAFFSSNEGKMGVVVTLIAVLELARQKKIMLKQTTAYGPIYIKAFK
jgi:segregation and condensation protein A